MNLSINGNQFIISYENITTFFQQITFTLICTIFSIVINNRALSCRFVSFPKKIINATFYFNARKTKCSIFEIVNY